MKITTKTETKSKPINPVTFEVTIETEEELLSLWAALNSSTVTLRQNSGKYEAMAKRVNGDLTMDLWNAVDQITDELNLKA